jgi:hypothetical protein
VTMHCVSKANGNSQAKQIEWCEHAVEDAPGQHFPKVASAPTFVSRSMGVKLKGSRCYKERE